MNFMKSIKVTLLLIVMASLLILSAASFFTTTRLNGVLHGFDKVVNTELMAQKLALAANLEFKRQVQEWKNTLIRGADKEQLDKYWGRFNSKHESTQALVRQLIAVTGNEPELQAIAEQFLKDHTAMQKAYTSGKDQYVKAKFDIAVGDAAVSGIDRAPSAALDELVDQLETIVNSQVTILEKASASNVQQSYIVMVIILGAVAVVSAVVIEKLIVKPLFSVRESLAALAHGDLTVTSNYHSQDEIGNIAESARQLQAFLHSNVETMKHTSSSLLDAAKHMGSMSGLLSTQASDQMHATDQVATAVQELSHSAEEVASNSNQTTEITQQAADKTKASAATANAAQTRAVSLVSDLDASASVIKELAENAANVSSVLDVIRGIAEQTNLLALNAAIEAARAGEQGRGFAVVADEVRTLAQRTQDSTAEIEKILDSVKSGADKAVVSMDTGQSRSKEVEEEITQATQLLTEIAAMVTDINGKNIQIATAANEQTEVTGSISQLIQDIHSLSEATNGRVEESKHVALELEKLVNTFEQQISRFTL